MVAWRWGEGGGGGGGIGEWGGRLVVGTWRREQGGGSAASQWEKGGGVCGMGGSGKGRKGEEDGFYGATKELGEVGLRRVGIRHQA